MKLGYTDKRIAPYMKYVIRIGCAAAAFGWIYLCYGFPWIEMAELLRGKRFENIPIEITPLIFLSLFYLSTYIQEKSNQMKFAVPLFFSAIIVILLAATALTTALVLPLLFALYFCYYSWRLQYESIGMNVSEYINNRNPSNKAL